MQRIVTPAMAQRMHLTSQAYGR